MTDELEGTARSRILSIIREEFDFPVIGEVTKVWPHTGNEDRPSNHEVDVGVPPGPNPETQYRRVPVGVPTGGVIATPREGDNVLLVFRRGEGNKPVVSQVFYGDAADDRALVGNEDDIRARRGDVEVELAGDGSFGRLALRSNPTGTPGLVVEVDSNGTIKLGDPSGTLKKVARKGDAVEVDDPDSGTITGQITEGSSNVEST